MSGILKLRISLGNYTIAYFRKNNYYFSEKLNLFWSSFKDVLQTTLREHIASFSSYGKILGIITEQHNGLIMELAEEMSHEQEQYAYHYSLIVGFIKSNIIRSGNTYDMSDNSFNYLLKIRFFAHLKESWSELSKRLIMF